MATHELKCHPTPFQQVLDGSKPFEVRQNDRNFQIGDTLHLREFQPTVGPHGGYTGRETTVLVTSILENCYGLPAGLCVLGLGIDRDARITELLEANNREVNRRREAERDVASLREEMAAVAVAVGRSENDGFDVDWFQLADEVREKVREVSHLRVMLDFATAAILAVHTRNESLQGERKLTGTGLLILLMLAVMGWLAVYGGYRLIVG